MVAGDSGALAADEFRLELVEGLEVALGRQRRLLRPGGRVMRGEARARLRQQLAQALDRRAGQRLEAADAVPAQHFLGDLRADALDLRQVVARGRGRRHGRRGIGFDRAQRRGDLRDEDLGIGLAMALGLAIVLAPAHLEDADLVVTTLRKHRCRNRRPVDERRADRDLVAAADREDLVDRDFRPDVRRYLFYFQFLAGSDAILLAAGFYDRVHGSNLLVCRRRGTVATTVFDRQPAVGAVTNPLS